VRHRDEDLDALEEGRNVRRTFRRVADANVARGERTPWVGLLREVQYRTLECQTRRALAAKAGRDRD
jgi:hypothetical protein